MTEKIETGLRQGLGLGEGDVIRLESGIVEVRDVVAAIAHGLLPEPFLRAREAGDLGAASPPSAEELAGYLAAAVDTAAVALAVGLAGKKVGEQELDALVDLFVRGLRLKLPRTLDALRVAARRQ